MINNSIVITKYKNNIISFLDVNGTMEYLSIVPEDEDIVGNIYVGRVKDVAKNINAYFVEVFDKKIGFLSFNDIPDGVQYHEGDCVCVQVVKTPSKNKEMMLTCKVSVKGVFSVSQLGSGNISVSRKINSNIKGALKEKLSEKNKYDVIIRTKTLELSNYEILISEIEENERIIDDILTKVKTRTAGTCIYRANPDFWGFVNSIGCDKYDRIVSDLPQVADVINDVVLYSDEYPLLKLYSIESKIDKLLERRAYLKNGGDIVIEHTEAMTIIDVNSGKNISNKNRDDVTLLTNLEACVEIARQIRLRNLSGIIIVDFINMKEQYYHQLKDKIIHELDKDLIRCDFVDFTKLGLAEIVRKKEKAPIYEIVVNNN